MRRLLQWCVVLLWCASPLYSQQDSPRFEDIFVTENVLLVNPPSTPNPLPQITLPPSVNHCPSHSSGRLEVTSPDGRVLIYGGCTFTQATELLNIPISLYDTQNGETYALGTTPLYTNVSMMAWLDGNHLALIGEARGGIGGAGRGVMVVDTAERTLVAVGAGSGRPPHLVPGTAVFEWVEFSFTTGSSSVSYDALTGEREKLFDIPHNPLIDDENSLHAYSNRSPANPEPDRVAVAFSTGGDHSLVEVYDLASGEVLHTQETNNRHTIESWIDQSRLLLLDTDWRTPAAILIEFEGNILQTHNLDNVYVNDERPQVSRALSLNQQFLLLRPNDDQIDLVDLTSLQRRTLVRGYPEGYTLALDWTMDDTLSAALLDGETVIARWFLRLKSG